MSNERVRLILGPANEVHWVKEIYRMFTSGDRTVRSIADELNEWKVPFLDGRKWQDSSVRRILMNPKYTGTGVYNQRRSRLGSKMTPNAETEWIVVPGAFEPIIDPMTFESAQEVFRNSHWNLSNEKLLEALRSILREKGKLSMPLLRGVPNTLTKEGYARRFGTLTRAFELVGYYSRQSITIVHRNAIWKVRTALMESLVELFPREISIHTRGSVRRNCLRLRNGNRVAVRVCRRVNNVTNGPVWILQPARREKRLISLLGCLNADNSAMEMVYVLPPIANRGQVRISRNHSWFKKGIRLENLSSFREAVTHMQGQGALGGGRRPKGWLSDDARAAIVEALRFRNAAKKNNVP
jgi:hypothetical protein